jgi:3-hydroxyacyl-CoA dehydrogenase
VFEFRLGVQEDIDRELTLGVAHPLGPLALAGLVGLDTGRAGRRERRDLGVSQRRSGCRSR